MNLGIFAVAAISTLSPSIPNLAASIEDDDYPSWAIQKNVSAAAYLHIEMANDGRIRLCDVRKIVGDERLGREICSILKRKRHAPPTGAEGHKTAAVFDTSLSLFLPDTKMGSLVGGTRLENPPDIEMTVKSLPSGMSSTQMKLVISYDASGRFSACRPQKTDVVLAISNIACQEASKLPSPTPATDQLKASPLVTLVSVKFVTQSAN